MKFRIFWWLRFVGNIQTISNNWKLNVRSEVRKPRPAPWAFVSYLTEVPPKVAASSEMEEWKIPCYVNRGEPDHRNASAGCAVFLPAALVVWKIDRLNEREREPAGAACPFRWYHLTCEPVKSLCILETNEWKKKRGKVAFYEETHCWMTKPDGLFSRMSVLPSFICDCNK